MSALEGFKPLFIWLLILVTTYGLLQWSHWLGDNKVIHSLIAFIVAIFVVLIPEVSAIISIMIPWFVLLGGFFLLLLVSFKIFGATDADIIGYMKGDKAVGWIILIIAIIIIIASISSVYGQKFLNTETVDSSLDGSGANIAEAGQLATGNFKTNLGATFFHPKILGMILIFLIATLTIAIITAESK